MSSAVLNMGGNGKFWLSGDIWQHLKPLLIFTTWGREECYWPVVVKGSLPNVLKCTGQATTTNYLTQKVNSGKL